MIRPASRAAGLAVLPYLLALLLVGCSLKQPPLTPATPAPSGWLDYLNYYRATARLPHVTENAAWSRGARDHAIYTVKHGVVLHDEEFGDTWYTPAGRTAAQQSNVFLSSDRDDTDVRAIDTWMQSPLHALGILDPRLAQVGYGSYREARGGLRMGAALNVIAGIDQTATTAYPIFWPGDGATVPSGLPLIMQIGSGEITPVVSATSLKQNGRPLGHRIFSENTYTDPDPAQQLLGRSILGARDAIVLIPLAPLSVGTGYTASITVNGQTHAWSFNIGGAAQAR
jgi:hypothetical protein